MFSNVYSYYKRDAYIDCDTGVIYVKRNTEGIEGYKRNTMNLNVDELENLLNDFCNINNSKRMKAFIDKYGLLDQQRELWNFDIRETQVLKEGYFAVAYTKEYREKQEEILELRKNIPIFKKRCYGILDTELLNEIEKEYENPDRYLESISFMDDIEQAFDDFLEDANIYLKNVSIVISYDKNFELHRRFEYPSLLCLLYSKLADELTYEHAPIQCKKCGRWMSWKAKKKWCSDCSPNARKEKYLKDHEKDYKFLVFKDADQHLRYLKRGGGINAAELSFYGGKLKDIKENKRNNFISH